MKRSKQLLEKRNQFVKAFIDDKRHMLITDVVTELTEILFISERTIYNIIKQLKT